MNITIDKAVVEQALAALEKTMGAWGGTCAWHADVKAAITELRAQAEQPAVPKPVVVSQGWTPTERELESVAEQIMRGIRSIGLWDARLGYTIRVLRDWLSASPSPAPAVPAHRVKSWGHCSICHHDRIPDEGCARKDCPDAPAVPQESVAWVERWYGSGSERGWWIVCGRDHIAHLGTDVLGDGDTVRKIVDAHNKTSAHPQPAVPDAAKPEQQAYTEETSKALWLDVGKTDQPETMSPRELSKRINGVGGDGRLGANTGHGHVFPRPDGVVARCGGPAICPECAKDLAAKTQKESAQPQQTAPGAVQDGPRLIADEDMARLRWAEYVFGSVQHAIHSTESVSYSRALNDLRRAISSIEESLSAAPKPQGE